MLIAADDVYCTFCGVRASELFWEDDDEDDIDNQNGGEHNFEYRQYDPKVISHADAAWTADVRIIGLNPESATEDKSALSAISSTWCFC